MTEKVKEFIDYLFITYKQYGISQKQYYEIVTKVLKRFNDNHKISEKKLELAIYNEMKKLIEETLANHAKLVSVVSAFINNSFNDDNDINNINQLNEFLNRFELTLDPSDIDELLKNNNDFYKTIESIFYNNQKVIENGNSYNLFNNNSLIITALDCYCDIVNHKVDNSYDINLEYNYVDSDSFKTYVQQMSIYKQPEPERERELLLRYAAGDKTAKTELVICNWRLVLSIASKYMVSGLDLLDLVQEGNFGLMKAVEKFDVKRDNKFSTYATPWIRQTITRAIADKARTIRIPVHNYERILAIQKAYNTLEAKNGYGPSSFEIAEETGIPLKNVIELQAYAFDTVSLSTVVGEEDDTELQDFIASDDITPEEAYFKYDMNKNFDKVFRDMKLTEREITVIMLRYGLDGHKPMTLCEIGDRFNLTRERIRQIEAKALKKIRKYCVFHRLDNLFGCDINYRSLSRK